MCIVYLENVEHYISGLKPASIVLNVCIIYLEYVKHSISGLKPASMTARPTCDQEVAGSTPVGSAKFFRRD